MRQILPTVNKHRDDSIFQALVCEKRFVSTDENSGKPFLLLGIEYKNPTWVWGADRKFRPEGHCLASRGCTEWCKTMILRDGIFYPHRTLTFDSLSCIPFDFECFILKVAYNTQWRWRMIFLNLMSSWCRSDVNLMTKLRDVLCNQCKLNYREKFLYFILPMCEITCGWDKNFYPKRKPRTSLSGMQEILFVHTRPGFPWF